MEVQDVCCDNNNQPTILKNWSKEERYQLLLSLKTYNYRDLEQIKQNMPTKSKDAIRDVIEYYKLKILQHPALTQIIKKETKIEKMHNNSNIIPLADWAKFLTNCLSFKDLHVETPMAIWMLAEFEQFPAPICFDNVDFKLIYHTLANALEGKTLSGDKHSIAVIEKCLIDTAIYSKAFIRKKTFKCIIKCLKLSKKVVNSYPNFTDIQNLNVIRHLASQRAYNPFNIYEGFLKPTRHK